MTSTNETNHVIALSCSGAPSRDDVAIHASWIPSPLPAALLCFVLSLAMHLPWLGITPIAGTEGHRIFPARDMVRSHQWLAPMLFGKPFLTKPPLHHWLIALSQISAGRENVFVWRLPSAIMGAALCAAACLFGARWFGRTAGLVSGACALGMIAIWGQSQVADIDSTNTFATGLAALCGIELYIASTGRRWFWVAAASLAMAAMWMTKGPAGLPIVLGVWIWAAVLAIREKRSSSLASPSFWLPVVLGVLIFVAWGLAAKASLRRAGWNFDTRGVREGASNFFPQSFHVFLLSLCVMLPELVAYSLPLSAVLLFPLNRGVRETLGPRGRRIAAALEAAVLLSWAVCVLSGMINPRYAYPTFILLCPLAGGLVVAAAHTHPAADHLRGSAIACCIALAGATVGLTAAAWKFPQAHALLIGAAVLAVVVATWTIWRLPRSWNAAWGLVVLVLVASIPFGAERRGSRTNRDSGIQAAGKLREIVGPGALVAVGELVTSKPETLEYAGVRALYFPGFLPQDVHPGIWVVLDQSERRKWRSFNGVRLEREQKLCRNGQTDYYVAWYANGP